MVLPYNPLTAEHLKICDGILCTIHEPIAVVQACIDCGFPAQDELATLQRQKQQAEAVKRIFFPDAP